MSKATSFIFIALLSGCASFDSSSPKYIFEAWSKKGAAPSDVKKDMQICGYKNTVLANDLSESEAALAEKCMQSKGYSLDTSSYRPNNCYGQNSPYLCNRLWGGKKPQSVSVRAKPTKFWHKPGVSGKDAYMAYRQCSQETNNAPEYIKAREDVEDSYEVQAFASKETQRLWKIRGQIFSSHIENCMTSQGFKYQKYPLGEEIYVPSPEPKMAWRKPGASTDEMRSTFRQCQKVVESDSEVLQALERRKNKTFVSGQKRLPQIQREKMTECMATEGFVWRLPEEGD